MVRKRLSEAAKKRLRAGRLLQKGKGCAEVALAVGVARQTVYTWKALLDKGGIDALRAVPERGRPAQLDEAQLASVRAALVQGPTEHDFGTELWTIKRVGALIERMHGVRFSQAHVWRLLGALGFSPQKPEKRAIERDEEAVRHWRRRTWPALKKSPARGPADRLRRRIGPERAACAGAHLGAQRPNSCHPVSLQLDSRVGHCGADAHPLPVSTARGQHQEARDRPIPQGAQGPLEAAAAHHLGRPQSASQPPGAPVPGHLERAYIQIAFLPPHAPDLNPVEYLWAWLKRHALANYCPSDLGELHTIARNKLKSAQKRPSIIAACWMQATLW